MENHVPVVRSQTRTQNKVKKKLYKVKIATKNKFWPSTKKNTHQRSIVICCHMNTITMPPPSDLINI